MEPFNNVYPSERFTNFGGREGPAQDIWKRFSFSNFLKTVALISTNWFDMRRDSSALEYEFTATLRVTTWKKSIDVCITFVRKVGLTERRSTIVG